MNLNLLTITKVLTYKFVIAAALVASACGGGEPEPEPPSESEKATELLISGTGTWTPTSSAGVTVDGVDVTDDLFQNFTITFKEGTYTTTGSSPVWPSQDTWRFKDETGTIIIRDHDEKEIAITEISASRLTLTLEWSETTYGGRKNSLKGKHIFTLDK